MHINLGLPALGMLGSYALRLLAAFLLCLAVSRLMLRPNVRFLLWLSFLLSAGACWVVFVGQMLGHSPSGDVATAGGTNHASTGFPSITNWSIPSEWSSGVAFAVQILAWGYIAGFLLLALRALRRRIQLRLVLRHASPASPEFERIFDGWRSRLGVQQCRLLVLPGLTSPATAYTWHPQILVPESLEIYLDGTQLGDVLCHELMHVKRRDYLWGNVSELIGCLLFYHPVVWLALRHLRCEREFACDDAVVRPRMDRRPEYAACLTRLARFQMAEEHASGTLNFATSGSFLSLRIRTLLLLEETNRRPWWKQGAAMSAAAALLAVFASLWPALAIMLRFGPPGVTAFLPSEVHAAARASQLRPHRQRRPLRRTGAMIHVPALTYLESVPAPTLFTPSAAVAPDLPAISDSSRLVTALSEVPDPAVNPATSAPEGPGDPVWTESPPQNSKGRSGRSPSWRKVVARVAAITLARAAIAAASGGDQADGGAQAGNNLLGPPSRP